MALRAAVPPVPIFLLLALAVPSGGRRGASDGLRGGFLGEPKKNVTGFKWGPIAHDEEGFPVFGPRQEMKSVVWQMGMKHKELKTVARSWWRSPNLTAHLWTWNSGKEDLAQEASKLFNETDADILVTCQTEGKVPIRKWAPKHWGLVSHAEHWGFAGGENNAQIMSVFIRQPEDPEKELKIFAPPEDEWSISGKGGGLAMLSGDYLMRYANIFGLVTVHTSRHQTSSTGKGGASVDLVWDATPERAKSRHQFLCAHLDSESDDKRRDGLAQMFAKMRTENKAERREVAQNLRLMWDMSAKADGRTDAVVVMGDLNFRLSSQYLDEIATGIPQEDVALMGQQMTIETRLQGLLSSRDGLQKLALADPLNLRSKAPSWLVSQDSLKFQCNKPYSAYLPTYKLYDAQSCADLNDAIESNSATESRRKSLALKCYGKKVQENGNVWAYKIGTKNKGRELQVGWLDRFCWRNTFASYERIEIVKEEGWANSLGSDHMPTGATLVFSKASLPSGR